MVTPTAEHRGRVSLVEEARSAYRAMAVFDRSIEFDPALRELHRHAPRAARKAGESEQRPASLPI